MDRDEFWTRVFVAGIAAGLTYGVTKKVLDVSEAMVIMMCVLLFLALGELMATPPTSTRALGREPRAKTPEPPRIRLQAWQDLP
jgi:hypothetical protein